MTNVEDAKNGPYCYFYKGETEKATKKRFGFGWMKINHSNVVLSKEYQGDFLDDTAEGIGKPIVFLKTFQG